MSNVSFLMQKKGIAYIQPYICIILSSAAVINLIK